MKNINVTCVSSREDTRQRCADLVVQNTDIDLIALPAGLPRQGAWETLSKTDVVVIDESILQCEGFAAVRWMLDTYQCINALIIMEYISNEAMTWTLVQGVRGVLLKTDIDRFLGKAIRRIHAGEVWMPRKLVESLRNPVRQSPGHPVGKETPQSGWGRWH